MICYWKNQNLFGKLLLNNFAFPLLTATLLIGALSPTSIAQVDSKQPSSSETPNWQLEAGGSLAFAVATVKPNRSDTSPEVNFTLGPGDAYSDTGGRFLAKNISLVDYIRFAYKLSDGQVEVLQSAAPEWITSERFDIQAKSEGSNPTKDQMRLMVQSLLADRFGLRVHSEIRQLDVLALVLAATGKLGPQLHLHPLTDRACSTVIASTNQAPKYDAAPEIPSVCGGLMNVGQPSAPSHVRIGGRRVPLALLAAHLGEMGGYNRPIVDQTGLIGTFDLVLEWGPDSAEDTSDATSRQTYIQEALKDQLGLKLERRKSPLVVLLIDHIDQQPSEN